MPNYFDESNTFNSFENNQSPLNMLQQLCYSCATIIDDYCKNDEAYPELEHFDNLPLNQEGGNISSVQKNGRLLLNFLQSFGNQSESANIFNRFQELTQIMQILITYNRTLMFIIDKLDEGDHVSTQSFYKLLTKIQELRDQGFEEHFQSLYSKTFRNLSRYSFSIADSQLQIKEYLFMLLYFSLNEFISQNSSYNRILELEINTIIEYINKIMIVESLGFLENINKFIPRIIEILKTKRRQIREQARRKGFEEHKSIISLLSLKISVLNNLSNESSYDKSLRVINSLLNKIYARGFKKIKLETATQLRNSIIELRNYSNDEAATYLETLKKDFKSMVEVRIKHLLTYGKHTKEKQDLAEEFRKLIIYF